MKAAVNIALIIGLFIAALGINNGVNDHFRDLVRMEKELAYYKDKFQTIQGSMLFEYTDEDEAVYENYRIVSVNSGEVWHLLCNEKIVTDPTPRQAKIFKRAMMFHEISTLAFGEK